MVTHKNIYAALAAAQAQMSAPIKGAVNPAFRSKYADLADVVAAAIPALTANGIAMFHVTGRDEHGMVMTTVLAHGESGTQIECPVPLIVGKNDMQGYKSATTYAKRIGLESVTGLAPEDDDGNAAAKNPPKREPKVIEPGGPLDINEAFETGDGIRMPKGAKVVLNATPRQRAEAASEAIIAQFAEPKTAVGLNGAWNRNEVFINKFAEKHNDLYQSVFDAFHAGMAKFTEAVE